MEKRATHRQKPTEAVARRKNHNIASRILAAMAARGREVLMRFYLPGQAAERTRADLGITEAPFRLIS